ncbi:LysR family transcriptional regulator [Mangrovicoccus ximenensis]|uniref:LysR family transcriptional regulator n=1 Tax=Mangrovicoccus ximenensis TaxID=1911570 RepID=UPI000D3C6346|nr:LysR family transcriptional regulator [Mangrovicoccus ximenensis]
MQHNQGYPIKFRQLLYLKALAEHGSISAAASALNMAQPSLSETIAKLEKSLGVQLAVRGARGIQMTEAGDMLARGGAELLEKLDELVTQVRHCSTEPKGKVSVGIPPGLSLLLSVPLLETIYAEYPDIRLSISEAVTGDILDWLDRDRLNLGLVYEAYDNANFSFEPLLVEELFLVTAPDNWEGEIGPDGVALDSVSARDLERLPLITTGYHAFGTRGLQGKVARSLGIELNVIATLDSLPQIVEMVSRASAYAILPHGAVHRQVEQKRLALVRIKEPVIRRTAYLARKRTQAVPRAVDIVEETVKVILRELVEKFGIEGTLPYSPEIAPVAELPPEPKPDAA